jgi:protein-tyrosine-phosphatase
MKKRSVLLGLVVSVGLVFSAQAEGVSAQEKNYFSSVMTILRTHIDALVQLTNTRTHYSDNVVRHAVAIHHTMGLFDHMDWTLERLSKLDVPDESEAKADQFNLFAKEARTNSRKLVNASKQWLVDGDRRVFLSALNEMSSSCNQCHMQLREKRAPILMTFNMDE